MQFWVYILRCKDGSYYTGHTDDLEKRLEEHRQASAAEWTRRRRPVELAWCANGTSRDEVFAFEQRVKNWSRAKKEAMIAGDWALVGHFARPPHERPSTSLGTSGVGASYEGQRTAETSFVPSEGSPERCRRVEGRGTESEKGK